MPRFTIHVPGLESQPYRIELDRPLITLGRGADNDVVIPSNSVSTHHANLKRTASGYELHDAGSTNGIMVDDVRHMMLSLDKDCTVYLGDVSMHFVLTEEELATLEKAKPTTAPPPHRVRSAAAPRNTSSTSMTDHVVATTIILLLAALAFFAGLAIRHQKETGASLIQEIMTSPSRKAPGH
ncbi:MAG: FHA domain-containing protein [Akkermansiaceae bacterium]|nr:FHA domain-containing protein [Akkermansiaceae bacterium]